MTPADPSAVAVLGCGTIGASWAKAFLDKGLTVRVWDPQPGVANRLTAANGDTAPFVVCDTPAEAVAGAAFVQESGPEDLALKQRLYDSIAGRRCGWGCRSGGRRRSGPGAPIPARPTAGRAALCHR